MASGDDKLSFFTSDAVSSLIVSTALTKTTFVARTGEATNEEFVVRLQTDTTRFIVNATADLASTPYPSETDDDDVVLIVGVVCGVVGVLLGVLLTFVFWVYKNKRKPPVIFAPGRLSSAPKKNPRERTFEPLDMSLTLDKQVRSERAATVRPEVSSVFQISVDESFQMTRSRTLGCHDYDSEGINFHQRRRDFDCVKQEPLTFESNQSDVKRTGRYGHRNPSYLRSTHLSPSVDTLEWDNRILSNSTRGSVSSGLGTGAESDIYPFENKTTYLPFSESINETRHSIDGDSFPMSSITEGRHSSSASSVTSSVNEVCRSGDNTLSEYQKRRVSNANASSYDNDWNPANVTPRTPSVKSTSNHELEAISLSGSVASPLEVDELDLDYHETASFSDGDSKGSSCSYENGEIVSTYLDLHIPNLFSSAKNSRRNSHESEILDTETNQSDVKKRCVPTDVALENSDEIIEL